MMSILNYHFKKLKKKIDALRSVGTLSQRETVLDMKKKWSNNETVVTPNYQADKNFLTEH
jgi:hypothetical protein